MQREFTGGSVVRAQVRTLPTRALGSIPGYGTKISQDTQRRQKVENPLSQRMPVEVFRGAAPATHFQIVSQNIYHIYEAK